MMAIKIFFTVVNMSVTASFVIIAVILMRFLLSRAPKFFSYLLWLAVLIRLLCPIALKADFGFVPDVNVMRIESVVAEEKSGEPSNDTINASVRTEQITEGRVSGTDVNTETTYIYDESSTANGTDNWFLKVTHKSAGILTGIWFLVGCGLVLYEVISCCRFVYRIKPLEKGEVVVSEKISAPFVLGILRPVIYLPAGLDETQRELVTAHEKIHVKHLDHLVKPLFLFACCVHWFNPLIWVAYYLMVQDMESACDEEVLRTLGYERKKEYAYTLLELSTEKIWKIGYPIAFGENSVKSRIKNVVKVKKTATWAIASATFAAGVAIVLLMINRQEPAEKITGTEKQVLFDKETEEAGAAGTDSNEVTTHEYYAPKTVDTNGTMVHLGEELEQDNRNGDTYANYKPERDMYAVLLLETPDSYEDLEIIYGYPVENPRISENFGTRIHPVTHEEKTHCGVDFASEEGMPVIAAASGTVVKTGADAENGNYVIVQHINGDATYYAHCAEILAEEGQEVEKGEQIATVGSTGKSTGPHLHFAVSRKGEFIEPYFASEDIE